MRRRRLVLVFSFMALLMTVGVYWALVEWRFRSESAELLRDVGRGFYAKAKPGLIRLTERRPNDGELQYQLGICEWAMGREDDAVKAWSRVPDGSPFSDGWRGFVSNPRDSAPASDQPRKTCVCHCSFANPVCGNEALLADRTTGV